jgi:SulP family sulfate permease
MLGLGLALIYGLPWIAQRTGLKLLVAIPPPLVCVVLSTVIASAMGLPLHTVADLGQLPQACRRSACPPFRSIWRRCASSPCRRWRLPWWVCWSRC